MRHNPNSIPALERVNHRAPLFMAIAFAAFFAGQPLSLAATSLQQPTEKQVAEYTQSPEPQRVRLLILLSKTGQHELASQLLADYPLQDQFAHNRTLYIEGLILKARKDYTGASTKFRAALADDPKLTLVRSELAQTLVILEQDDSAMHHLKLLAADAPNEESAAGVRAFIDQVDERRPYKINGYVSLAPSTNVNNGSNHQSVYSPFWQSNVSIDQSSQKTSGFGAAAGTNVAYSKRLGNDFSFVAGANGEARIYTDHDFNAYALSQSAELRFMLERGYLGIGGVASQSLKNDEIGLSYVAYGPRLSARYNVTTKDSVSASLVHEWRNYIDSNSNDGTAILLNGAWSHAIDSSFNITVFGGFDRVDVETAQFSFDTYSGGLNIYKELPMGITTSLSGEVRQSDFEGYYGLAGDYRDDTRLIGSATLTKRDLNIMGFAPSLGYTYVNNASNIANYDYDSHAVDFRLTKDF